MDDTLSEVRTVSASIRTRRHDISVAEPHNSAPIPAVRTPLLEIRDLEVQFRTGGQVVRAVNHLSFRLDVGRSLAIVGESGSGKSVSCRALMGLLPKRAIVSGSARFLGTDLIRLSEFGLRSYRGGAIGIAFQDAENGLNPTMKVGRQISETIRLHRRLGRRAARSEAIELLRSFNMATPEDCFRAYPHELSGGMRQRVMLAIALAGQPKLLIADETTRALDVDTQAEILRLLKEAQRQHGMAIILISHDLAMVANFVDDILVMYRGMALEHAPTRQLLEAPVTPYARALLAAWSGGVKEGMGTRTAKRIEKNDAEDSAFGCPFAPRCPNARSICSHERPPLTGDESSNYWACWNP